MALTNNISYCGKYSFDLFSGALFNNDLFDNVTLFEGVKNKITLPTALLSPVVVSDTCAFTDSSTLTLSPRELSTCAYKLNFELCVTDLEPTFLSERMRAGATHPVAPSELIEWVRDYGMRKIGNDAQANFWGSTASDCLGIFGLLGGTGATASFSSGVIGVTAAASVTAGNVMTELSKVYAAIPAQVKQGAARDLRIFVSQDVMDAYLIANATTTTAFFTAEQKIAPFYLGIPLYVINTTATRKMVAVSRENIVFGTDLLDDQNEIRVIDLRETTGDNKIRFVARFRAGQQVRVIGQVVYYSA